MTPSEIEPATFRFVAQSLNQCATAVPVPARHTHTHTHKHKLSYLIHSFLGLCDATSISAIHKDAHY
jgi:hypothetical protein